LAAVYSRKHRSGRKRFERARDRKELVGVSFKTPARAMIDDHDTHTRVKAGS
jgi:hypothetical protein